MRRLPFVKEKIALVSILINAILAGGKVSVGLISHSVAILSEGLHSLMDIFSSTISYIGIKASEKPADKEHPYGHYKFEVLSGVIIMVILLLSGVWVIYEAYRDFLSPVKIRISYLSILVMGASAIINGVTSYVKISVGKREGSYSLLADGFHDRTDVFSSLGVFIGLFLIRYWVYMDSILAILVGLYIIRESVSVGKEAVNSLLDVSAGEEIENQIKNIAQQLNIEVSSLKTQKKGAVITANLEIDLPKDLDVEEATRISDGLRKRLMEEIKNLAYVAIQIRTHETEIGFYKPSFGRSFGWQRQARSKDSTEDLKGHGPEGYCVCPKCGYRVEHQRGVPCSSLKCPNCNIPLKRE